MGKKLDKAIGATGDTWSKLVHDQTDRTGLSAARVAKSIERRVHPDVVALQVNINQQANNPTDPLVFTGDEMKTVAKWFAAIESRVALTGVQSVEIQRNQSELDGVAVPRAGAVTA